MLSVMMFTVFVGPRRKFVKHRKGYNEAFYILKNCTYIDDSIKYGLILPIIKTIAMVGDEHNALAENGYLDIFESRNAGSSYDTLCQTVQCFGVYKMNWIVARCSNPLHPEYSENSNVVRPWQNSWGAI